MYANPAEQVELLSLGQDQTLGLLLDGVLSANDQEALLVAFREYASPRRMPAGTKFGFSIISEMISG
ncbi:MAG: hypothetical protein CM1200mP14_28870 [Gammaproteobacteria bacterium]|nr:MAG: hypothetical protein CM1200mP14_28870 [Gammaproteobacteria bacterium]